MLKLYFREVQPSAFLFARRIKQILRSPLVSTVNVMNKLDKREPTAPQGMAEVKEEKKVVRKLYPNSALFSRRRAVGGGAEGGREVVSAIRLQRLPE